MQNDGYNIDGLILSGRHHTPRTLKMIEVASIPVVEIMDCVSPCLDTAVGFNNFEAAWQMTRLIVERGHRQVVYFGARQDERTLIKQQGYEQGIRDAGLPAYSVMMADSSNYSAGVELLRQAQREYPGINSIISINDDLVIGALFECQRQGIAVPDKMVIAGFHGNNFSRVVHPRLASVLTPREEMGRLSADCLLARLRGEPRADRQIDVGFTLLTGGSI